jgi:hypothetical protein
MAGTNTLLIIGNGFDLRCGLQTSYGEFFEWLRMEDWQFRNTYEILSGRPYVSCENAIDGGFSYMYPQLPESISVWEIYFIFHHLLSGNGKHWFDIEEMILGALRSREAESWCTGGDAFFSSYEVNRKKEDAHTIIKCHVGKRRKSSPYVFLLGQLDVLEYKFARYIMGQQVDKSATYSENARQLVKKLATNPLLIMSFNYTTPEIGRIINVHGIATQGKKLRGKSVRGEIDLGPDEGRYNEIIFGVDDKAFLNGEMPAGAEIFSKTYRKLLLKEQPVAALDKGIKQISFFGHSLSDGDYSYFQSIFDFYEIYESDVALAFFFVYHGEKPHAEQQREKTALVYKLLKAYGKSMSNKDQGDNLIHKLMLEGRVRIDFDSVQPPA